jgi:hypothetical protein
MLFHYENVCLFQRGIQTLTNLFRPKSKPSSLNGIQQINHHHFYLRVI